MCKQAYWGKKKCIIQKWKRYTFLLLARCTEGTHLQTLLQIGVFTGLIPRPSPSFPSLAVGWEAGREGLGMRLGVYRLWCNTFSCVGDAHTTWVSRWLLWCGPECVCGWLHQTWEEIWLFRYSLGDFNCWYLKLHAQLVLFLVSEPDPQLKRRVW